MGENGHGVGGGRLFDQDRIVVFGAAGPAIDGPDRHELRDTFIPIGWIGQNLWRQAILDEHAPGLELHDNLVLIAAQAGPGREETVPKLGRPFLKYANFLSDSGKFRDRVHRTPLRPAPA